ncbi:putative AC transposase [Mycena venus]|uniref:Putative AC transposase n=1 Tax=Mycena venus TaxID=2733690 RepID=A0A8H7CC85_9AGAR|nr:putative AC transposase [Mycena venus]
MASPVCQCGNPLACNCFVQTPRRNDFHHDMYSTPSSREAWHAMNPPFAHLPQTPFMTPNPAFNPAPAFHPAPSFGQQFGFQNTFPATFNTAVPPPSQPRVPFVDATNTINSAAATAQQKRKRTNDIGNRRTRRRVDPRTEPAVFGVGPSTTFAAAAATASESVSHPGLPQANLGSLIDKPTTSGAAATDVWFFVRGAHTDVAPNVLPPLSEMVPIRPDKKEFSHLSCRFCPLEKWTTWKNVEGQTASIRHHLKTTHTKVWKELVFLKKLKGYETLGAANNQDPGEREEFSIPVFYDKLAKWIAVDDQAYCTELRDLLLFIGTELEDEDIPHHKKNGRIDRQRVSGGIREDDPRDSDDIWSRGNLDSHLAITAHYIVKDANGRLVLKTRLVAFRRLEGSHTGENIGKIFVQVVKEIGCLHKIGMVTCDNASNNNTHMTEICAELARIGIPFDAEGNRIRCFPHVVNIAVKTALKELVDSLPSYHPDVLEDNNGDTIPQALRDDPNYWRALLYDPVAEARTLVTACRASGQRRDNFETTIKEGNAAGGFGEPKENLRVVGLLKDVETRWSATFLMIDRLLEQHLAVDKFLDDPKQGEISWHRLSPVTLQVLQDIRQFLQVPHLVQEIVSGEQAPTLSYVLPLYEQLIVMLKNLVKDLDKISIGINAAIRKLEEYLNLSRRTRIYALAMVLNPTIKLQWLRENWSAEDANAAKNWVRAAMLEYRKEHRSQGSSPVPIQVPTTATRRPVNAPSASHGARAHTSGFARLNALSKKLSGSDLDTPANATSASHSTEQERAEAERRAVAEDERIVDEELNLWEAEGRLDESDPEFADFDLLRHWEARQFRLQYLFRVALDVLPVQASAVPCERVFSSSKETDSLRRSSLSPRMIEMLQILKFIYRQDRLKFCDDLIATEAECSVIDVDPKIIEELLASGRIQELEELVNASWGMESQ